MKNLSIRPFGPTFNNVGSLLDDVFNRSLTDVFGSDMSMSMPSVNIMEDDRSFRIELAAPGLTKEEFDIKSENDVLTISVRKSETDSETSNNYVRREFNFTSFKRSFQLPDSVEAEAINATYEHGVLLLNLPKREEEIKKGPRKIEIL
jgi:HSP20 family protein